MPRRTETLTTLPRATGPQIRGPWRTLPSRMHDWPDGPPLADTLPHERVLVVGERRIFAGHPSFVAPEPERLVTTLSFQDKVNAAIRSGRVRPAWASTQVMLDNAEEARRVSRIEHHFAVRDEPGAGDAKRARVRADEGGPVSWSDGLALLAEQFAAEELAA